MSKKIVKFYFNGNLHSGVYLRISQCGNKAVILDRNDNTWFIPLDEVLF